MKKLRLLSISILAIIFIGCAGNQPMQGNPFEQGEKLFEEKQWSKAKDKFNLYLLNNPGGNKADSAQYLLAESHYNNEKYLLAISEYKKLKNRYSYSDLVREAEYKIGMSYVKLSPIHQREQKYTRQAIQQFQNLLDKYPESEYVDEAEEKILQMRNKLARKRYSAGIQYKKMHRWKAALIYFNKTLDNYYDTPVARKAQKEKAYCLIKLRKFDEYKNVVQKLKQEMKNNKEEYTKAEKRLKEAFKEEKQEIKREKEKREGRF